MIVVLLVLLIGGFAGLMFTCGRIWEREQKQFKFVKIGDLVSCEGMSQELVNQLIECLKKEKA